MSACLLKIFRSWGIRLTQASYAAAGMCVTAKQSGYGEFARAAATAIAAPRPPCNKAAACAVYVTSVQDFAGGGAPKKWRRAPRLAGKCAPAEEYCNLRPWLSRAAGKNGEYGGCRMRSFVLTVPISAEHAARERYVVIALLVAALAGGVLLAGARVRAGRGLAGRGRHGCDRRQRPDDLLRPGRRLCRL